MIGTRIPYHLRVNKHVDREVFFEAIEFMLRWTHPESVFYVSLGGPFLSDLHAAWKRFGFKRMMSLEADESVYNRQQAHRFTDSSQLVVTNTSTQDFIADFDAIVPESKDAARVIWFDLTSRDYAAHLVEFGSLFQQCDVGDVLRITLNANADHLCQRKHHNSEDYVILFRSKLEDQMSNLLPQGFDINANLQSPKHIDEGYAQILLQAVQFAAVRGLEGYPLLDPLLLTASRYADGDQMLTATYMIVDKDLRKSVESDSSFAEWDMRARENLGLHFIAVPDLSVIEQDTLLAKLPPRPTKEDLHEVGIDFQFVGRGVDSAFLQYKRHSRRYPKHVRAH